MANTIRLIGSGPLAGRTWYGTIAGISAEGDRVILSLDEPWRSNGARDSNRVVAVDVSTGCMMHWWGAQSDLISTGGYSLEKMILRIMNENE